MTDDLNLAHAGVTGVSSAITAVMAFFGVRMVKQIDANTKDISEHKVEIAGKYATNADVKDSLARIHDRIDVLTDDIKTLIGRR